MRYVLMVWAAPLILFWGWYFISFYDLNFGYVMLSRDFHNLLFEVYGDMIGLDPATLPPMVAKACILDTALLLAIWAFRARRTLIARFRALRERYLGAAASPSV